MQAASRSPSLPPLSPRAPRGTQDVPGAVLVGCSSSVKQGDEDDGEDDTCTSVREEVGTPGRRKRRHVAQQIPLF